ncbi:hypothetical protein H9L19_06320 [Weissella diestrammenae]|uniref:Uncharacterized protein n=1 Tax=Weissella diestrammenae TaxID=1162633 RepID=A0A7G9T4H2_9LACO|nr:hypothetical protein [Weissella diestrammenae]MCM0582131.1 hypothetical protein [Weissella diestrammenae]QNN74997.1 hypothetical protein H9L19_06320 [Weissella diestrammenae]
MNSTDFNTRLRREAIGHGFNTWEDFEMSEPRNAANAKLQVMRNDKEVSLQF